MTPDPPPTPPAPARRREAPFRWRTAIDRLPIYPFEWLCLLLTASSVAFLRSRGMRIDWRTVEHTVYPMLHALGWPLLLGVGLQLAVRMIRRQPISEYFSALRSWRWWGLWLRLWIVCMALTYTYFWVKACVPLLRTDLYDPQLWNLDRLLHLGFSPSIFATALFENSGLAGGIDRWYAMWASSVLVVIAFVTADTDNLLRRRFMLSCVFLWGLGCWLYVALPALGPVFYAPDLWQEIAGRIPRASAMHAALWANYQKMLAGRSGVLREFNPIYAVAAMPSLHVGAHALFTFWAWRAARPVAWLFVVASGLTFLGSLVTGWHYAVDGYAGLVVAFVSYRLAVAIERATRRPGEFPLFDLRRRSHGGPTGPILLPPHRSEGRRTRIPPGRMVTEFPAGGHAVGHLEERCSTNCAPILHC